MNDIGIFYYKMLNATTSRKANEYLKQRGFIQSSIISFSIGFSPIGGNNIIKYFGNKDRNYSLLKEAGMIITNRNNQIYDRFQGRIVFPMRDKFGRIIAFGGRVLDNKKPKYLNSPETNIFSKSKYIYGLYEVQKKYSKLSQLLVVEGYIDVITLTQFGISYVVSSLGTSITSDQIQLLYRVTDKIILCYDGDIAGRKAAWKALKCSLSFLNEKRELCFMFLPENEDPDTYIRNVGKIEFEKCIDTSQPFSVFLFRMLLSMCNISNPEGRAKLHILAMPLINEIPSKILRFYLRQHLSYKLGMFDDYQLDKMLLNQTIKIHPVSSNLNVKYTIVQILIGLLIQYPNLSVLVPLIPGLEKHKNPEIALFLELVKICNIQSNITTEQILANYQNNKYYAQLKSLSVWNHMVIDEMIETVFIDTLIKFYNFILEQYQKKLIAQDRIFGLNITERKELWLLTKTLATHK